MTDDRTTGAPTVRVESAVDAQSAFGLYPASDFRLTDGRCRDCPTIPQALWYFRDEIIAVAKPERAVASFASGMSAMDDVRAWLAAGHTKAGAEYPPLVWVASREVIRGVRLSADATTLQGPGFSRPASLVQKIALNRSYFDQTSAAFFAGRPIKARGETRDGAFVLRTLWPEDFRIDRGPSPAPLSPAGNAASALRALVRGEPHGGACSPFAASTLWRRDPAREAVPRGRAVLAIMLNGAQGDDDEAHGGHFALVTGRTQEDGAIGDWLVNNFYTLDSESEKGILAAPVPLDNYLADLNSGQGWYRPSQMLVLVLASDRAAALVQAALNRTYNQFWRHQLRYRHATMNCTGISVDVLRTLGWPIPPRGPTSRLAAALGFPFFVAKERSVAKARIGFDYLVEDLTRLLPAAAFEECGAAALALAAHGGGGGAADAGPLARMLAEDTDAIVFVRFPQFPSSRVFGDFPVVTPWEFQARMPSERRLAKIIPVPPRPFPDELRDPDLVGPPRSAADFAMVAWGLLFATGVAAVLVLALKQLVS
jgi:hypothetical protein